MLTLDLARRISASSTKKLLATKMVLLCREAALHDENEEGGRVKIIGIEGVVFTTSSLISLHIFGKAKREPHN